MLAFFVPKSNSQNKKKVDTFPPSSHEMKRLPETVETPTNLDILCGRGIAHFKHEGNVRFRMIISTYIEKYKNAISRQDKTDVIRKVTHDILKVGGRFLKKPPKSFGDSPWWFVMNLHCAYQKVGHALRDASIEKTQCMRLNHVIKKVPMQPSSVQSDLSLAQVSESDSDKGADSPKRPDLLLEQVSESDSDNGADSPKRSEDGEHLELNHAIKKVPMQPSYGQSDLLLEQVSESDSDSGVEGPKGCDDVEDVDVCETFLGTRASSFFMCLQPDHADSSSLSLQESQQQPADTTANHQRAPAVKSSDCDLLLGDDESTAALHLTEPLFGSAQSIAFWLTPQSHDGDDGNNDQSRNFVKVA